MKFLWPIAFVLMALLPLLVVAFLWAQRRRRRVAVRFSSLSLVRVAVPAQSRVRRYLPPALFLLAIASLVIGVARPVVTTRVPFGRATVMLAMDVSTSMLQNDVAPSRLYAAEDAALSFIRRQQENNQIGIVAFASFAQLVQAPTTDAEALEMAVLSLGTGRGTAIGSGILTALEAIHEFSQGATTGSGAQAATATPTPLAKGDHVPDIIVLLTDGMANAGVDPLVAAQQAADAGVRVYTIGYGTNQSGTTQGGANRGGANRGGPSRGGNGFFGGMNSGIDEASLKQIAEMTGGKYYTAGSASELRSVFASLPTVLATKKVTMEISMLFAGAGALLVVAAVVLSQLWHPMP